MSIHPGSMRQAPERNVSKRMLKIGGPSVDRVKAMLRKLSGVGTDVQNMGGFLDGMEARLERIEAEARVLMQQAELGMRSAYDRSDDTL